MRETGLYRPLNTLKPIAAGLWIADGPATCMAAYGTRIPFPTRMTVARMDDGGLWCHSPIAPDAGLFAAIDALGAVRHLVSPNKIHYAHIAAWKRRYRQAVAWASPGVRERAAGQGIEVAFDADLDDTAADAWTGTLDQLRFRGSRFMDEIVFLHRASRTLILADLIENFEAEKLPPMLRLLTRLAGSVHPHGKMPLDLRLTYVGRKRTARASLARMLAWQPRRVILAHGRCYLDGGAMDELHRAFAWLQH